MLSSLAHVKKYNNRLDGDVMPVSIICLDLFKSTVLFCVVIPVSIIGHGLLKRTSTVLFCVVIRFFCDWGWGGGVIIKMIYTFDSCCTTHQVSCYFLKF